MFGHVTLKQSAPSFSSTACWEDFLKSRPAGRDEPQRSMATGGSAQGLGSRRLKLTSEPYKNRTFWPEM